MRSIPSASAVRTVCCLGSLLAMACIPAAGIRYQGLPKVEDGALHVVNFHVGQAEALFLTYKGRSMLVDCGSGMDQPRRAQRVIPRRLDALLGHRHIDYFVVTHYHQDHIGTPAVARHRGYHSGLFALLEREGVTIGTLLDRGFWNLGPRGNTQINYEGEIDSWLRRGIVQKRRVVKPGDRINMGEGLRVRVVSSSANGILDRLNTLYPSFINRAPPSENDYSVGLKITLGDFELFSAGDLSGRSVLRQYGPRHETYTDVESHVAPQVGPVEVYRVNHHGSRHSSNACFSQTLQPQVSVFSTGYNHYGHPDPDVYKRLKAHGDVYITGDADPRYRELVKEDIVGDDVEVLVAPDGRRFWVNGRQYHSLSDSEELARPIGQPQCKTDPLAPDDYEVDKEIDSYGD